MEETRTHTHEESFSATQRRLFAHLHTPSAIRGWWGAARAVVLAEPGGDEFFAGCEQGWRDTFAGIGGYLDEIEEPV